MPRMHVMSEGVRCLKARGPCTAGVRLCIFLRKKLGLLRWQEQD